MECMPTHARAPLSPAMQLAFHVITGKLVEIKPAPNGSHLLCIQPTAPGAGFDSAIYEVPCSMKLHDCLHLDRMVGFAVVATALLNADGSFIDTSTLLFSKADEPRIILPGQ